MYALHKLTKCPLLIFWCCWNLDSWGLDFGVMCLKHVWVFSYVLLLKLNMHCFFLFLSLCMSWINLGLIWFISSPDYKYCIWNGFKNPSHPFIFRKKRKTNQSIICPSNQNWSSQKTFQNQFWKRHRGIIDFILILYNFL